jgi:glycosyltransferase involved in cell wall biosynthesis
VVPQLSFVVPAHDEAQVIGATLSALHAAAREVGRPYEVVVVDDASTDGTGAIARASGAEVVTVSVRQIAAVRNAGAKAAAGTYLFFVDADTSFTAETLRAAVAAMEGGAAGGGARVVFDGPVPGYAKFGAAAVLRGFRLMNWTVGCFMFCTRAAFDAMGGFDERLFAAEEVAFSRGVKRTGRLALVEPAVVTSARKFRTHSRGELLRMVASTLVGPALLSRRRLKLWYGSRRHDPGP